jgi:hypothetical protein
MVPSDPRGSPITDDDLEVSCDDVTTAYLFVASEFPDHPFRCELTPFSLAAAFTCSLCVGGLLHETPTFSDNFGVNT